MFADGIVLFYTMMSEFYLG